MNALTSPTLSTIQHATQSPTALRFLPRAVQRAIIQLCRRHSEWGTVDGAYAQCLYASQELRSWLQGLGHPCDVIPIPVERLINPHPHWESFRGRKHCIAHYAVQVGQIAIDLTARQFDPLAPFPNITNAPRRQPTK